MVHASSKGREDKTGACKTGMTDAAVTTRGTFSLSKTAVCERLQAVGTITQSGDQSTTGWDP